jgi:hypothetical protein
MSETLLCYRLSFLPDIACQPRGCSVKDNEDDGRSGIAAADR